MICEYNKRTSFSDGNRKLVPSPGSWFHRHTLCMVILRIVLVGTPIMGKCTLCMVIFRIVIVGTPIVGKCTLCVVNFIIVIVRTPMTGKCTLCMVIFRIVFIWTPMTGNFLVIFFKSKFGCHLLHKVSLSRSLLIITGVQFRRSVRGRGSSTYQKELSSPYSSVVNGHLIGPLFGAITPWHKHRSRDGIAHRMLLTDESHRCTKTQT